jgi:hypothetical protein
VQVGFALPPRAEIRRSTDDSVYSDQEICMKALVSAIALLSYLGAAALSLPGLPTGAAAATPAQAAKIRAAKAKAPKPASSTPIRKPPATKHKPG